LNLIERFLYGRKVRRDLKQAKRITAASIIGPSVAVEALARLACKEMMRESKTRDLCRMYPELSYELWRATFGELIANHPEMRPCLEQAARLGVNQEAVLNLFFHEIRRSMVN